MVIGDKLMVSSIGSNSSNNAVAQVLQQQNVRVEEQKAQDVTEQRRQAQIELVEETKATQRQANNDDRLGRSVDITV
jgi:hypothetical protein